MPLRSSWAQDWAAGFGSSGHCRPDQSGGGWGRGGPDGGPAGGAQQGVLSHTGPRARASGERATPAAPGWALPAGCFRSSRTWRVPSGPDAVCRDHILVLSSSQVTPPPAPSQLDLPLPTAPCHASVWDPLLPRSPVTCPRVASWNMAGQGDVLSRPSTSGSRPPPPGGLGTC